MRLRVGTVVLVMVVILAGCSAPATDPLTGQTTEMTTTDEPPGSDTATETTARPATTTGSGQSDDERDDSGPDGTDAVAGDVRIVNGSLPASVNATLAFRRMGTILGAKAPAPRVWVGNPLGSGRSGPTPPTGFRAVLGIGPAEPSDDEEVSVGGVTNALGTVYLLPRNYSRPATIERTLAHEYVHVYQFANGAPADLADAAPPSYRLTTDAAMARRAVLEGAAVVGSDAYAKRYLSGVRTETAILLEAYDDASAGTRLYWAPYRYGQRYVRSTVTDASAFDALYANGPATTEQVLDNATATGEPRARLDVSSALSGTGWHVRTRDSMGELFVRVVLRSRLPADRSRRLAEGWGADRLVEVAGRNGTERGYAWVLRWDSTDDAREFERGLSTFVDERRATAEAGLAFRTTTVGEETVVLFAGSPSYVERATAVGRDRSVTLSLLSGGTGNATVARARTMD